MLSWTRSQLSSVQVPVDPITLVTVGNNKTCTQCGKRVLDSTKLPFAAVGQLVACANNNTRCVTLELTWQARKATLAQSADIPRVFVFREAGVRICSL